MGVALLLAAILALVLVPPALRAHTARQHAFLLSIGSTPDSDPVLPRPAVRAQCRRRIASGLLVAMTATLVAGVLPGFRVLLVVHLFLLNAFIAYIGLLAYWAERALPAPATDALPAGAPDHGPAPRRRPFAAMTGQPRGWMVAQGTAD